MAAGLRASAANDSTTSEGEAQGEKTALPNRRPARRRDSLLNLLNLDQYNFVSDSDVSAWQLAWQGPSQHMARGRLHGSASAQGHKGPLRLLAPSHCAALRLRADDSERLPLACL